eukprot:scaffold5386_cov58-Cylindrotheca_fusiformis.AAC.1
MHIFENSGCSINGHRDWECCIPNVHKLAGTQSECWTGTNWRVFVLWMRNLKKVTIPSKVTVIGNGAFQKCTLLQRLVLREGLERIGVGCFSECGDLTTVGGPSTVTKIDGGAFQRCSGLERLLVRDGLEEIGKCAFSGC